MITPPQIELTLTKQITLFTEITLVENIDINLLDNLIHSQLLEDKYDNTNYSQVVASHLYINEKNQLEMYKKNYNKKNNNIPVVYKKPRHGWGRPFPVKSLGLTSFSKKTRNTLIKDTYIDIDLSNAQPKIISCICNANNISCDKINEYNNNRPAILEKVMTAYNVSRDQAKGLFIRLAFFGSFDGWLEDCGLSNFECLAFIYEFKKELDTIANKVRKHNTILYETARKIKTDKHETNIIGSFFSLYLQEYETRIMEACYLFLKNKTDIIKGDVLTYEFDGFKLLKSRIEDFGGVDALIIALNDVVLSQTGFEMKFEVKDITKFYDVDYVPFVPPPTKEQLQNEKELDMVEKKNKIEEQIKKQQEIINEFNEIAKSEKQKRFDEWELTHGKIINKAVYYCELPDTVLLKTPKQLSDAFSHLKGFKMGNIVVPFTQMWMNNNPSIKSKDDLGVYPNESLCPSNIYNLWKPFPFKNKTTPYTKNPEALTFFRNHILTLCNNDVVISTHFEKWIGHMFQHPELKSICPVIISQQGSGKGSLMKLLTALIGHSKFFETSNPARDIWGAFNTPLANSFLVNLDELNKKDTIDSMGKIKALITEPTITINTKNVVQYDIQSYHRFIITTNITDPIPSEKGDRRMWIIKASDALKGDTEYFNKFNELLTNEDVLRTVFDYFNEIPELKTFGSAKFPMTEYQQNIQECNKTPIELWLEHYVSEHYNETEIELLSSEIFRNFENYRQSCKFKFEITLTKLIMSLYNLRLDGIKKGKHTNRGNTVIFDIVSLKKHFNLNNLVDMDNFDEDEGDTENDDVSNDSN